MKTFSHKGLLKLLMLVVACATFGRAAAQDTPEARLYIEDFTVSSYDPVTVSVNLENSASVGALNFDLELPDGLEMVGKPEINPDRKANGMSLEYNPAINRIGIFSLMGKPFTGNDGPVLSFTVKAAENALDNFHVAKLWMKSIAISSPNGAQDYPQANTETKVTFGDVVFTMTAPENISIVPGKAFDASFGLENSVEVTGLQVNIVLPEGFTVDEESFAVTSRCNPNSMVIPTVRANGVVNLQMLDLGGGNVVNTTGEGDIVTFKVNVPAEFTAETAELKFNEGVVSALGDNSFDLNEVTVTLSNNEGKLAEALEAVQALRDALAAALETIATEAPNVKDQFTGEAIETQIDALENAINEAYNNGTLVADYETVMAPKADIEDAIAKLIEDAQAAQADNEAKHTEALATIDALRDALAEALETIATEAPDVKDEFPGTDIETMIDELAEAIEAAYENGTLASDYENLLSPTSDIEDAITELIEAAKAAQAAKDETDRKAANQAAYDADLAAIAALQSQLDAALAEIAASYGGYVPTAESAAIQSAINAASSAAHAEFLRVANEGTYVSQVDSDAIAQMITDMLNNVTTGIDDIIVKAENGEVMIFTLDGKKVARPVSRQVNVFVDKAGNTFKKYVR